MKKIVFLVSLFWCLSLHSDKVDDFLDRVKFFSLYQRNHLGYYMRLLESLNADDRTILYVFLEELNDERQPDALDDFCSACEACQEEDCCS